MGASDNASEQLAAIAANCPGIVYRQVSYPDGRIEYPYVSEAIRSICGLEPEQVMVDASLLLDRLHPADQDRFQASLQASAKDLSPWSLDFRIIDTAGEAHWLSGNASSHRGEGGEVVWDGMLLDIARHKRQEDRSELLIGTLDGMSDAVAIWAADDHLLGANRAWFKMMEAARVPVHVGIEYSNFLHSWVTHSGSEEAIGRENQWIEERIEQHRHPGSKIAVTTQSGRSYLARDYALPDGGVMTFNTDITEHANMEAALSDSEERLRSVIENSPDSIILTGRDGRFQMVNKTFLQRYGLAEEQVIGRTSFDIHPRHIAEYQVDQERKVTESGANVRDTATVNFADGREHHLTVSRFPVLDSQGQVIAVGSISVDVTEQRHAEETLRESQERFKDMVEVSADWYWEMDENLRFTYLSSSFAALGVGPMEYMGSYPEEVMGERYDPDNPHIDLLAMRSRKSFRGVERRSIFNPDWWVSVSGRPVFSSDGTFLGYRGTTSDITERKHADASLRRARDELEAKVAERTQALQAEIGDRKFAQEEATRADQAKSEFLSSMSHELRTPLNAILGFAQILRDYSDSPLTGEQNEFVKQILNGGQHLLGLVNEVLDLSKIEAGGHELSMQPVNPGQAVRESVALVRPLADKRGIAVTVGANVSSATLVRADPNRLKQVLLNLLSNAVNYNRDEGTVNVDAVWTDSSMLRISVTDTGSGIPDSKHDEVFRPFSRLGAETSNIQGTGIGLTLSRQLMNSMGGRLDFESSVGVGSTFWIEISSEEAQQ
jgi:PAS domain S-box-containing protein